MSTVAQPLAATPLRHEALKARVIQQPWLDFPSACNMIAIIIVQIVMARTPNSRKHETHDRIVIRIEPGMAFGTGTHETTRLCLVAIEKYFAGGSFLDVGTGTGILAIAAAKMFPNAHVEACDTDADAVAIATENARLNGVFEKITFRVGTVEETTASADLVCANLTADMITVMLPSLISVTCGHLVLSGILDTQSEALRARMQECGLSEPCETMQDGEWIALVV